MEPFRNPDPMELERSGATVMHVSALSRLIRDLLDDDRLRDIWVKGEVTNYKHHSKGHRYFSISETCDRRGYSVPCVMWRTSAYNLAFAPHDGMEVLVRGSVEVYEPKGRYQFIVREMIQAGAGEKHLLVERWKRDLESEGLFSADRKQPLPQFPARVGVVTSKSGAAFQDVIRVITHRYPVELVLSPTAVQGDLAHLEIAEAIRKIDGCVDVIIVGRGGGSFEDLFAFNHPDVIRAVATCSTPVISAVGHEVDVTLCDHAADARAPTPSAGAALAVPDRRDLMEELRQVTRRLENAHINRITRARNQLEELEAQVHPVRFRRRLDVMMQDLVSHLDRLERAARNRVQLKRLHLAEAKAHLDGMDPFSPLKRGYCLAEKGGHVVASVRDLREGDRLALRMADGRCITSVEEVEYGKKL